MVRKRKASIKSLLLAANLLLAHLIFASTMVTNPTGSVNPNQVNHYGEYRIQFTIANNSGAVLRANTDYIIITFDGSINMPSSIPLSAVTVNGAIPNSMTVSMNEVSILTPLEIPRAGAVEVIFSSSAGIKNPTSPGSYWIEVYTNKQFLPAMISPLLTISASTSTVTQATVTPNPSIAAEAAAYNLAFNLGTGGALAAGTGQIAVIFPGETYIPPGSISGVTVNSTSAAATSSADTVFITTPVDVDNDGGVTIDFALGAGLVNPTTDGTFNLIVKTSSEPTEVASYNYSISPAGQLSITAISSYPDTVNQAGEFIFDFRTGSSGALSAADDSIYIVLPANTLVPSTIVGSNLSVSSGGFSDDAAAVYVFADNYMNDDTLIVVPKIPVANTSDVTLTLKNSAGISSPSIAGAYSLQIKTTAETSYVSSNPYTVFETISAVSNANISPANTNPSVASAYGIAFNAGRYGRLYRDSSKVILTFNTSTVISENSSTHYDSSYINVGGTGNIYIPPGNISADNTSKKVIIKIPGNVAVLNNSNIQITLDGTNQPITNPVAGNYSIQVNTSVESTPVTSNLYNIGGTEITLNSVTLSRASVNATSGYIFNISIQSELNKLDNDQFVMIFPEGTVLPPDILSSQISIKGVQPLNVSVNQETRTISARVNAKYTAGDSPFDVAINSTAGIINPVVPSNSFYKATLYTSKDQVPVNSAPYALSGNDSSLVINSTRVLPAAVNANPAKYIFDLTTSAYGKIAGGQPAGSSTITVSFDSSTIVPPSIDPSAISVNGNATQGISVLSSGNAGKVEVSMPSGLSIENSAPVSLVFDYAAGLANDSIAGTQNVRIFSASDTVAAIASFDLSASQELTFTSVAPSPATQNASASYAIKFTTGSLGSLTAGQLLILTFPENTYLPATMDKNDITVNGVALSVNPSISGRQLTIGLPSDIGALVAVTVLINQAAGILNPTAVNAYTLNLVTSSEPGPFSSPAYSVSQTASTVSAANVSPGNGLTNTATNYTIAFNLGNGGRLISGSSTISVEFNANSTVSTDTTNNYDLSTISVNGGGAQSLRGYFTSISGQTLTITVPSFLTIANNDNVVLFLSGSTEPIINPATSGDYTLQVKTSVENIYISSNSYAISTVGPVSISTVALNAYNANSSSSYTLDLTIANQLTAGSGTITFTFPDNTLIPASLSVSEIHINTNQASAVTSNPTNRTVTMTTPITLTAGTVQVIISSAAGIENPSERGNYTLEGHTSAQPLPATSPVYNIIATDSSVVISSIVIAPETPSSLAQFSLNFITSDHGRMVAGLSSVYIVMPVDAAFIQGTPSTSKVLINSTAVKSVALFNGNSADEDTIVAVVPNSVTIGNSTGVTFSLDATSGFQTPSNTNALTYKAYTSVDNIIKAFDHSLPVELALFKASSSNGEVVLSWVTESELNNAYWIIERKKIDPDIFEHYKATGSFPVNGFQLVDEIEGMGTVSGRTEYKYLDKDTRVGDVYLYRIADVSYDGTKTDYAPVAVEITPPEIYELSQNYPNPFNPSTTILFNLPRSGKVSLIIYDIMGREIKRIIDKGILSAGKHEYLWDSRNHQGQQVASGVYFYRIKANDFSAVRKMILLK